jgi:cell division protein FtsN
MAKRRAGKKVNHRGARRKGRGIPSWVLLFGGMLIGLGISVFILFRGSLTDLKEYLPIPGNTQAVPNEAPLVTEPEPEPKAAKPRYDFFTVLPEMEVVVPDQQLSREAQPGNDAPVANDTNAYILQVGSFRSLSEAEQMKAQLALMGIFASVQSVKVNETPWHRVRVGPVSGARKTDEMRIQLQTNGIDTLVMKATP